MKYRNLNGTSLEVSSVCLGTMTFGDQIKAAECNAIMDRALEAGINFFDTANVYTNGESEKIVGKWLRKHRQEIILATKVRGKMGNRPGESGLSRKSILHAVDESLKRLRTEYIDIYYMHMPDDQTHLEETLHTMHQLVEKGKIRYYGVSNYAAWQIADMLAICEKNHWVRPIISQSVYNLITRSIENELLPFLKRHDMALAIYNPIAGGLLAGKHQAEKPMEGTRFDRNQSYFQRYWSEKNFSAVASLSEIASSADLSLLQLSLKWCHENPLITSVIFGVSRMDQIEQNLAAIEGAPLDRNVYDQCDAVWLELTGNRFMYNR